MVNDHVLDRFLRVVQVVRPITVVVVVFALPVQRCMRQVDQGVHRRANARQRYGLPEHAEQDEEDDSSATHFVRSVAAEVATRSTSPKAAMSPVTELEVSPLLR